MSQVGHSQNQGQGQRSTTKVEVIEPINTMSVSSGFSIDKNVIMMITVAGVSFGLFYYLFRELKKIKEDVRLIKSFDNDDLLDKVEQNSESVRAVEIKLDQLIMAINVSRKSQQQQLQQSQQQSQQVSAQVREAPRERNDPPPVMGGKITSSLDDPGIIKL